MTNIEPAKLVANKGLTKSIKSFWTDNVNAEQIMERDVSSGDRGSEQYFEDLSAQRYRSQRYYQMCCSSGGLIERCHLDIVFKFN